MALSTYDKLVFQSSFGPLPYRIWRPDASVKQIAAQQIAIDPGNASAAPATFPVLLFLHGAGERGVDNEVTLVHGATDFASPLLQGLNPSYIVIPQCPEHDVWASIERTHEPTKLSATPSPALQAVRQLMTELLSELPIDPRRIYLTGLSMGGYGAWDLLTREPDLYAAAVLICGGADCHAPGVAGLASKPLWVCHGDCDDVVPVARSREIVHRLRELGGSPRYTEYVGGDHDSWTATYRNPEIWKWLFSQCQ